MLKEGSYQELQTSDFDFTKLLGSPMKTEVAPDSKHEIEKSGFNNFEKCSGRTTIREISNLGAAPFNIEETKTEPVELAETRSTGNVKFNVYLSYVFAGGHYCKIFSLLLMCIVTQILASGGDYWINYW